ncbi:DUF3379 family protein [Shewanella sp. NIFS-20-20]|uniref:DUF3379 family protein n=1 Tax=Shewanella sp. NIFS-20-20 TaxID=2853806 RepID=UPI001C44E652|nr:DUF3379 family protein [Shewanella sp. NIFS-20-20]MBV7315000.1 DUF3379 domain-containing protein [Shewanella sp. NIFS-20-20]
MDELRFRRQAVIDPNCQDDDFIQAASDPDKAEFIEQMKTLDDKIHGAFAIPTPPQFADKLLLNTQLKSHYSFTQRLGVGVAMAASIAFVSLISFSLLRVAPIDLSEHALTHVHHETQAMQANTPIPIELVNEKLGQLFPESIERFVNDPGDILFATYCDFQGVQSLHLVLQHNGEKVTVFIVPQNERFQLASYFNDAELTGASYNAGNAYMLLVANNNEALNDTRSRLETSFI